MRFLDIEILKFIYGTSNKVIDNIMPIITSLGNGGVVWIIIIALLIINKKYRKIGILAACALALVTVLGEGVIKHIIQRPRPFIEVSNIRLLIPKPSSSSFPSGHTASSFAVAFIVGKKIKKLKLPVYILAAAIAFSRLYLFVHYPTDIIGGIVIGVISGSFILYVDNKIPYRE